MCHFIMYSSNLSLAHVDIFLAIILRIPAHVVETTIVKTAGVVIVKVDNNNQVPATTAEAE